MTKQKCYFDDNFHIMILRIQKHSPEKIPKNLIYFRAKREYNSLIKRSGTARKKRTLIIFPLII